ncbi:phage protease [uncultured Methanobrevibacter sp.]|uniref:phage protease n=1 Tax=uncultured Methanobrevibacter sp. TaxID=253161 RepID=UPI0025CD00D8|nr:phage protease [uncultured Methanobrevibacter sp.]
MLEDTNIWTTGPMNLWVNNEPAKVYVPETNVKSTYEILQSRLSKQGSIPIGIDHLADNIIEANPILAKLNLLDVGEITKIKYADDTISIVEAELTNPLIKQLYENGELDMVSIVANSTTSECPKDYDYIVDTTDITRVDIVEKGACPTCSIPKPSDGTVVYARYSIQQKMEDNIMAEELTMEAITEAIDKALEEKLAPINERLDTIEEAVEIEETNTEDNKGDKKESEEVKAMKARIAELQKETATAKVDSLIAAGKILPAQKDSAVSLCASDAAQFDEMYKDAPVIVDLDERVGLEAGNSGDGNKPEPTEDEQLIANVNAYFNKGE